MKSLGALKSLTYARGTQRPPKENRFATKSNPVKTMNCVHRKPIAHDIYTRVKLRPRLCGCSDNTLATTKDQKPQINKDYRQNKYKKRQKMAWQSPSQTQETQTKKKNSISAKWNWHSARPGWMIKHPGKKYMSKYTQIDIPFHPWYTIPKADKNGVDKHNLKHPGPSREFT